MIDYRLHGSKRLDLAVELVTPLVRSDSVVLDIGCGIGILAEQLGRVARNGRIVGVDISERNIWYANRSVDRRNVSFLQADPLENIDQILGMLGGPADGVVMIDVIEHIPDHERGNLLHSLSRLCAPSGFLVITFPSPSYQRFLMENDPSELQIIDNVVEPDVLLSEGRAAGFVPVYYSLVAAGHTNQYAHCVFRRGVETAPVAWNAADMLRRLPKKIARLVTHPLRVRRYKTKIFSESEKHD